MSVIWFLSNQRHLHLHFNTTQYNTSNMQVYPPTQSTPINLLHFTINLRGPRGHPFSMYHGPICQRCLSPHYYTSEWGGVCTQGIHIHWVTGHNIGTDTGNPEVLLVFLSPSTRTLRAGHDRFLPHSFTFFIHTLILPFKVTQHIQLARALTSSKIKTQGLP